MCIRQKTSDQRIDPCIRPLIKWLNDKHITVASCCGHGRYPMTIVIKEGEPGILKNKIIYREIISQKIIPRIKRFYRRDPEGYYYIPEVSKPISKDLWQTRSGALVNKQESAHDHKICGICGDCKTCQLCKCGTKK